MPAAAALLSLLVKAAATAAVVVAAARVAERVGPFAGGLIATLPVSAGPAYLFVALANDDRFVADSALASAVTNAATLGFLTVLVLMAPRHRRPVAMGTAVLLWLAAAVALQALTWTLAAAVAVNGAGYAVAWSLTRSVAAPARGVTTAGRWYDTPVRAALVAVLVVAVATLSGLVGPAATGIAAVFPIVLSSVAVIVHARQGGPAAAAAMAGALAANPGFLLGLVTVHTLAEPVGRGLALIAALAVMLAWTAALLVWRRRAPVAP